MSAIRVLLLLALAPSLVSADTYFAGVLSSFYDSTQGDQWFNNTNWKSEVDHCLWYGVVCVPTDLGVAITLYLDNNNLNGPFPSRMSEFGFSIYFGYISAANNNLQGTLPDMMSPQYRGVNLTNNQLEGPIPKSYFTNTVQSIRLAGNRFTSLPDVSAAVSLLELDLGDNQLGGEIPQSFFTNIMLSVRLAGNTFTRLPDISVATSLLELDVGINLLEGEIPRLPTSLRRVALQVNKFRGPLPDLAGCTHLEYLDLSANQLTGAIPSTWNADNILNMTYLNIYSNLLEGGIPDALTELTTLQLLDLSINTFIGGIPIDIGKLTNLRALRLHSNNLSGTIPQSLYDLQNLELLTLNNNGLVGNIQDLSGFPKILILYLSFNQFSGSFPTGVPSMTSLSHFVLTNNNLTGTIPDDWINMSNLTLFDISSNQFSGPIPQSFSNLKTLRVMLLGGNKLTGGMDVVGQMTGLNTLDLSRNNFTGSIPADIFHNLNDLISVNISKNAFSGRIPLDYSLRAPVQTIDMSENQLIGYLVDNIQFLTQLVFVNLSSNRLTGNLPAQLVFLANIEYMDFSNNHLSGIVPAVGGLQKLKVIRASNNQFYGDVTSTFSLLVGLQELSVGGNDLTVSNFEPFYNLVNLETWNMTGNNISGSLGDGISNMRKLSILDLSNNTIPGTIPKGIFDLPSLRKLKLNNNQLTGPVSNFSSDPLLLDLSSNRLSGDMRFMARLSTIEELNLSNNSFSGPVPDLNIQVKLKTLKLDHNQISGLPISFTELKSINTLDFSSNLISGVIPDMDGTNHPNLTKIDLTGNSAQNGSLIGEVPANAMCDMSGNSFICPINKVTFEKCRMKCTIVDFTSRNIKLTSSLPRNQNLLETIANTVPVDIARLSYVSTGNPFEISIRGPNKDAINEGSSDYVASHLSAYVQSQKNFGISSAEYPIQRPAGIGGPAIAGIVIGVIVILLILAALTVYFLLVTRRRNMKRKKRETMLATMDRLLIQNVVVQTIVGSGNFGEVYRGEWNGITVAIKSVKNESEFEDNQFKEEIFLLEKLNHPNVIRLFGVFIMDDSALSMVLEFAGNGSLDSYLGKFRKQQKELDVDKMLFMVLDLISGMVYLQSKTIIHRDLAARNLLLDQGMNVKISDFGLSRQDNVYSQKNTTAIPYRWAAPEVMAERVSTVQSDVWSFGITVWEIFSYAIVPYRTLNNKEVSEKVPKGLRLEQPETCPPALWDILTDCWAFSPSERPTFDAIRSKFTTEFGERLKRQRRHTADFSGSKPASPSIAASESGYHTSNANDIELNVYQGKSTTNYEDNKSVYNYEDNKSVYNYEDNNMSVYSFDDVAKDTASPK